MKKSAYIILISLLTFSCNTRETNSRITESLENCYYFKAKKKLEHHPYFDDIQEYEKSCYYFEQHLIKSGALKDSKKESYIALFQKIEQSEHESSIVKKFNSDNQIASYFIGDYFIDGNCYDHIINNLKIVPKNDVHLEIFKAFVQITDDPGNFENYFNLINSIPAEKFELITYRKPLIRITYWFFNNK